MNNEKNEIPQGPQSSKQSEQDSLSLSQCKSPHRPA